MSEPRSYSQADLDDVLDNPEWTAETTARAQRFEDAFPDAVLSEGLQDDPRAVQVSLRLDRGVVDHFRSAGGDWRKRINEVLRKAAGL